MSELDVVTRACMQARKMMERNAPRRDVLGCLVAAAEEVSGPGAVSSVLVLDADGLLRNGASPRLPWDYLNAIDRLKPNPHVGTCAAAAATGSVVITPSFLSDDKWSELRHLPLALGFVGAWSMPIKSTSGRVLGTFGTYFTEQRGPSAQEMAAVEALASAAARALEFAA
jgi:GAF domain-containing protein